MSLMLCPECGHQVSSIAPSCVSCGHPIAVYRPPVDTLAAEKTMAHVGYGLLAAGYVSGITWIAAVILAYVKRKDARGTWLESHYDWQIETFWWPIAWVLGLLLGVALFSSQEGQAGADMAMVLMVVGILSLIFWTIYRVIKGWIRLAEGKPVD